MPEHENASWMEVHDRVKWWLNDMAYKPPEVLNQHYYDIMAQDIANVAVGYEPVAHERLDEPKS